MAEIVSTPDLKSIPTDEESLKFEKIDTYIHESSEQASFFVANEIAELIRQRQKEGKNAVLGLATGSTPTKVYEFLVKFHQEEGLSFKNVITFNLDEYFPMEPDSIHSYVCFMNEHLFDHLDIKKSNINIPDGTLDKEDVKEFCEAFEQKIQKAGGIDIQILGIG
ncbi:MAG: 6-phosphogluconolactonase, partial [Eudoraea sp.]|nr:6-phosphogluconolactonase [Eudoraea sp.]